MNTLVYGMETHGPNMQVSLTNSDSYIHTVHTHAQLHFKVHRDTLAHYDNALAMPPEELDQGDVLETVSSTLASCNCCQL